MSSVPSLRFVTEPTVDIDERLHRLAATWDEDNAVAIGQILTHEQGEIEDMQRRNREEERRRATANAFRLARWTALVMGKYGDAWYEWMVTRGATALEQQTLIQYKSELLRIAPDNQGAFTVYPSVYRAAALLTDADAQANLLAAAEQLEMPAAVVRRAAQVMRDTGSADVPTGIHEYRQPRVMPDAPDALTELWAVYTMLVSDAREMLVRQGMDNDKAMSWALRWNAKGQEIVRRVPPRTTGDVK